MIHRALKQIRLFHGLKQNELAERLGVSTSYLSEIESGIKSNLTLDFLKKYADEFGISISSLLLFAENIDGKENKKSGNRAAGEKILKILEWISEDEAKKI